MGSRPSSYLTTAVLAIFALAMDILTPETRREWGLARLEMTRPEDLGREGPAPELRSLSGLDALADLVVGLAELSLVAGMSLAPLGFLSTEYLPTDDAGRVQLSVDMPAGSPLSVTSDKSPASKMPFLLSST